MPRQARLDTPGTLHHVIVRGIEKRPIVKTDYDRNDFVSRMGRIAIATKTPIYAWALMTNHVHILLHSGPLGLPNYMRRLLTGYVVNYNRRYQRHGPLFQNRYKSILCDEDSYFTELARYIHLNPLRVKLVSNLTELEKYPWCGHGVIIGRYKNEWQERDYVLAFFGKRAGEAQQAYRRYVRAGASQGRRPELVGGGLVRSQGGWSEVVSMRRRGQAELADQRILGRGDFVERIIQEAEAKFKTQYTTLKKKRQLAQFIRTSCKKAGISPKELSAGSRRSPVSKLRAQLALKMVEDYGMSYAATARQLGVSTVGIFKIIQRANK